MPLDFTYRIQLPHRPGSLARVAGKIAEGQGLIGDVNTVNVGREASIRGRGTQMGFLYGKAYGVGLLGLVAFAVRWG